MLGLTAFFEHVGKLNGTFACMCVCNSLFCVMDGSIEAMTMKEKICQQPKINHPAFLQLLDTTAIKFNILSEIQFWYSLNTNWHETLKQRL